MDIIRMTSTIIDIVFSQHTSLYFIEIIPPVQDSFLLNVWEVLPSGTTTLRVSTTFNPITGALERVYSFLFNPIITGRDVRLSAVKWISIHPHASNAAAVQS
jgi:hypothetical protein